MADFDVFNGDADGICALLQLRLAEPRDAVLVTGVKRDISLLGRVRAGSGDRVTVLDVSLDKNRDALVALLASGAQVFYADHHHAGDIPDHPGLDVLISTAPEASTSALVNGRLRGAHAAWAVVGCYGDNLDATAEKIAANLALPVDRDALRRLGILLNYNGYGAEIADLHIAPDALFRRLLPHPTPMALLEADRDLFDTLETAYADDMRRARDAERLLEDDVVAVVRLPDTAWARRVSGVYGNELANAHPDRAHAVLTEGEQGWLVSVRAPLNNRTGADEVCRQFDTGGGRAAAAGINVLPEADVARFVDTLRRYYAGSAQ